MTEGRQPFEIEFNPEFRRALELMEETASGQRVLFTLGMLVFLLCAALGWVKLRYGFNFIDEGYQMVESWRLAAGDHFLKDGLSDILLLYTHINALLFDAFPDLTLLGFRRIQYLLTFVSLASMALAMVRVNKEYWPLPWAFSLFAFTGLDPMGAISNLNYYTYPHALLTAHVSLLVLGVQARGIYVRSSLLVMSGCFLWLLGFSAFYLCAMALAPATLYVILRGNEKDYPALSLKDLALILAPVFMAWTSFIGFHKMEYISAVIESARLSTAHHWSLHSINWEAIKHFAITLPLIFVMCLSLRWLSGPLLAAVASLCSLAMGTVIWTSVFGLVAPYYNGWFGRSMWLASLMLSVIILIFRHVCDQKNITHTPYIIRARSGGYYCSMPLAVYSHERLFHKRGANCAAYLHSNRCSWSSGFNW